MASAPNYPASVAALWPYNKHAGSHDGCTDLTRPKAKFKAKAKENIKITDCKSIFIFYIIKLKLHLENIFCSKQKKRLINYTLLTKVARNAENRDQCLFGNFFGGN